MEPAKDATFKATAITVVLLCQLSPAFFGCVLWRNRNQLDKPQVKQKIGTLYFGFLPTRPYVGTYSVVFLVRRNCFILMTFLLLEHPGLQIQMMLGMTTLYMCYVVNVRFHESTAQRRIEVINEFLLAMLCTHYVAFTNPVFVWEKVSRDGLGTSIIVFVCTLLGVNTLVILTVSVMA